MALKSKTDRGRTKRRQKPDPVILPPRAGDKSQFTPLSLKKEEKNLSLSLENKTALPKPHQQDKKQSSTDLPFAEMAEEELEGLSEEVQGILKREKGLHARKTSSDENLESTEKEKKREKATRPAARSELEDQLVHERNPVAAVPVHPEYTQQLSQQPMDRLYNEMTRLYHVAEEKGYLNLEEQRRVLYLTSAVEQKVQAAEEHHYTMTEEVAAIAGVTRQLGSKLKELYKGQSEYHPQYR